MMDNDYFKQYNDTYGHLAGGVVLQNVASVIKASFATTDLVARYGGEEFLVVIPETTSSQAISHATALIESLAALHLPHAASLASDHVTLSIGITCLTFPTDLTPSGAIQLADQALYQAKEEGRNRYVHSSSITFESA